MAADAGYMVCALNNSRRYHEGNNNNGQRTDLITRDLLGESFSDISAQELDVNLQVTTGWPENCLELVKSGKGYLKKRSSSEPNRAANYKPINNGDDNVDLKSCTNISLSTYKSVCTLDKVKSALQREKLHGRNLSSNSPSSSSTASTLSLETTTSMRLSSSSQQQEGSLKLSAAGCSNCLMYVMISNENPKCPKCNSMVSLPVTKKKPRIDIDLNLYL